MSKITEFCNALTTLGDGRYHYWNGSSGVGCSDYVRMALALAGVITNAEANDSTNLWAGQGYRKILLDTTRFTELPASTTPQKGDIYWYNGKHVSVCAGGSDVWEAAPEASHDICSNGKTGVGLWKNHNYNCSGGALTCIYRIKEGDKMKNTELVSMALNIAQNYPTHYRGTNGSSEAKYNIGAWDGTNFCFDCSGLIKAILWGWNGNKSAAYGGATYCANGVPDINDAGFYQNCEMHTDFSNIVEGALLWKSGHVGIYVGNGYAVECTPAFNGGVQKTAVSGRGWSAWGIIPYVEYGTSGHSTLQYGSTGSEVKTLQTLLNSHGASLDVDGSFGNLTKQAVISFQTANGLVVDGIVGNQTWTALEATPEPTKTLTAKERLQIAIEIIDGKWGSGSDRKQKLISAYGETEAVKIQNIVNTAF